MRASARRATRQDRTRGDQTQNDSGGGQLRRQVLQSAPVAPDDIEVVAELVLAIFIVEEGELQPVGRRRKRPFARRQRPRQGPVLAPVGVHEVNLGIAQERDCPPVGRPGRSAPVARQPPLPASVGVHCVDARCRVDARVPRAGFRRRASARRATRQAWRSCSRCASASAARSRLRSRHGVPCCRRACSRRRSAARRATRQEPEPRARTRHDVPGGGLPAEQRNHVRRSRSRLAPD